MSILKKCATNNRQSARPNKSQPLFGPVGRALSADSSEVKPDGPWPGRLTFIEDFTLEHSHSGLRITSIEFSGSF
jgi:hypothetical protein